MDPKNQNQPLKKIIPQLLISVSLFSFIVSYSSLYNFSSSSSSSLINPGSPKFHHFFSANSFQLNKNYLFLICNGLLVFLAKTSGFIQPPIARDLNVDVLIGDTTFHKYVLEEETTAADPAAGDGGEKSAAAAAAADGLEEVSIFIAESEEEEGEIAAAAANDAEIHENEPDCRSCWLFDEDDGEQLLYADEDEDEEEEVEEEMSTEELNQKFEAFIRKMKEEIVINEARQKALMLN